jgi:tetratricopeptide (TPR) repeat protein
VDSAQLSSGFSGSLVTEETMRRHSNPAARVISAAYSSALASALKSPRRVLPVVAFLAMVVAFPAGTSAWALPAPQRTAAMEPQTVTLDGFVRGENGQAITSGAMVRLESSSGELIAQQPVTTAGQFDFAELPKLVCRLIVTASGYETYLEFIDFRRGATQFFVNVTLRPAMKIKTNTSDLPTRTDQAAPKNAQKEFGKGERALEARNLGQARTHLEKAVAIYPCYARAQASLALVLIARHDSKPAEAALRKAIQCDPDFIDSYIELGELLNGEKRYNESRPVLEEGVRRSPGAWQFHYQLGVASYGLGRNQQAEEQYRKVLALSSPPPSEVHVKLADVYIHERNFEKAYAEMQAYLTAEPKGRFAARIRNVMAQMVAAGAVQTPQATRSAPPSPQP